MNLESSQFWIAAQEAEIMQTHAAHFSYVRLIIEAKTVRLWGYGVRGDERNQYRSGDGKTVEEAVAALAAQFPSGQQRINKLRDQAKDLLRQAAEIEKESAP
jgi:hypothetical protein